MSVQNNRNEIIEKADTATDKIDPGPVVNGWRSEASALSLPEVNASVAVNASANF